MQEGVGGSVHVTWSIDWIKSTDLGVQVRASFLIAAVSSKAAAAAMGAQFTACVQFGP